MRKIKLFLSLLMVMLLSIGQMWATEVTWPGSTALPASYSNIDNDANVQIKISSTNSYTSPIRIYANITVSIKVAEGYTIESVTYEASSTGNYVTYAEGATVTPNVTPTTSGKKVTWSFDDETSEFTFKPSTQTRSNGITVVYSSTGDTPIPAISLNPNSLNLEATGNNTQVIALSATDFSSAVNNIECAFFSAATCEAGDAISQPSWITDLTDNNSTQVSFNVSDNDGAARSVWMKVTASQGTESASAILAISQKVFVLDYATLPFSFTGGKTDVESTSGMTQSGLGADYSGVTTKLKFDGSGDYVIIHFNAAPGILSYDIKGNTFSGGTFKIQESADGQTYTDKASYTGDGTGIEVELSPTARYVKFVYVTKSSGNIGLGNISISEPVDVAKPTISGETPFLTSTTVTLTQAEADAIYYTTDEAKKDNPSVDTWTEYNSANKPSFSATTTIYAAAIKGSAWSAVAEKTFTKPLTVAEAIAAIPNADDVVNDQYVRGIVCTAGTSVNASGQMTYYISADGTEATRLQIYLGKNLNNTAFTAASDLAIGDRVVVFGQLKNYKGTKEMNSGNYLVSKETPAVAAPVFSPNGGGFMGETDVTITCETEGSAIYYTLDGTTTPTKSSTPYEAAIHLDATTTIKAIAYVGDDASLVITKTFTLTAPMTVADALTALDSENPINNVAVAGIISTAPEYNPSSGKLTYFISDDGSASDELEVYKGFGVAGASFSDKADLQVGDEVTVFGNLTIFNTTKEFAEGSRLLAFNRPVVPSISANPVAVDAVAHAAQSVTITYENWGTVNVADADATLFDDADCTIAFSGEWINNVSLEAPYSSVSFDIAANTGAARTAYMKIYALGDDANTEAEKVIAISQEEYVAPAEPATLPFAFDGGKADIEDKDGMTQEGLDSDYGSSPKLKFNTTGDWVIIWIDGVPGKLTYDIKGNSFSGGTFKVQESADGETYTDVATYTELGETQSEEQTLLQSTRFVKFIYTNKVNGNVALGNIAIAEYVAPPAVETPEISGDDNFLTSTEVSMSCATDGAAIYYTTNADNKENPSVDSWTLYNSASKPSFSTTTTVYAAATHGNAWSAVAEMTFTKVTPYATIADLAEAMTSTATQVYITLGNWQVSAARNNQAFVTDGTNGLIIYESGHGLAEGNVLSGTIQCNLVNYNGVVELTGVKKDVTDGLGVADGAIAPVVKTIAEANALGLINTGLLVQLENVTYNGGVFEDDNNNSIAPYTSLYNYSSDLEDGKKYNITGIIQLYNSTVQIYPRKQADIEEVVDASAPETPIFSPAGGEYTEAQNVTISCATEGAAVYYTTDGSAPDNTKTLYAGAISVSETMTIKAVAIKDDKSSAVATATYTINIPEDESNSKTWDLSKASYDANPTADQVTWSATYVSMVADKNNASTAANNYLGGDANNRTSSRFYSGSTLTITPNGKEITSVVFTATSTSYANALQGSTWTNASASVNDKVVTVTPTDGKIAISAAVGGTCGFTAVQVNYKNIAPEPPTPATPDYTRNVTVGNYGTICLPQAGTIEGATLFEIGSYENNMIYIDEVIGGAMEAGRPYIFQATATELNVTYTSATVEETAGDANGLYGFYDLDNEDAQFDILEDAGNYILYSNQYWLVKGRAAYIANYRAYIKIGAIQSKAAAPGRRRVAMAVNGEQVATGIDALNASEQPIKMIIDGQLFIIRGEKMYNVNGQLVK